MQSTALDDLRNRDKVIAFQKNQFVMCPTHQEYEITNICMKPNCLEPLCPECIRIHQYVHAEKHDSINIDTIQHAKQQCIQHLKSIKKEFEFEKQELTRFSDKNRGEMIDQCKQKLKKAKEKAIDIVVNYFTTLENQIGIAIDKHEKEHPGEYVALNSRLEAQLKKFDNQIIKLEGSSYVKPTLKDQNNEYESMRKEIENAIDFYHKDMADIFVDESKLYTLNMELSKYVVFKIGGPPEGSNYQPLKISQLTAAVPAKQQILPNRQIFSINNSEADKRFDSKYKEFLYASPNKISSIPIPNSTTIQKRQDIRQDNKNERVVGYEKNGQYRSSRQIESIFDKYQTEVQQKNARIMELQQNQNLSHFIPGVPQQRQQQNNVSKYDPYDSLYNQSSAPKSRFKI